MASVQVREKDTGNEYIRSAEPKRAIRHYNRSVALDASVGAVYANRALAYLKLKQFAEAENDCDIALARGGDPVKVPWRNKRQHLLHVEQQSSQFTGPVVLLIVV